jgi:activating signal cointegrator 1
VKALTLIQPWASLIVDGKKWIETRSWPCAYRGMLAIHAGRKVDASACAFFGYDHTKIPTGAVLGVVRMTNCLQFPHPDAPEDQYGDFHPGRYGFILSDVEKFAAPILARGSLGLWDWTRP